MGRKKKKGMKANSRQGSVSGHTNEFFHRREPLNHQSFAILSHQLHSALDGALSDIGLRGLVVNELS
jgi:hypothetical protein